MPMAFKVIFHLPPCSRVYSCFARQDTPVPEQGQLPSEEMDRGVTQSLRPTDIWKSPIGSTYRKSLLLIPSMLTGTEGEHKNKQTVAHWGFARINLILLPSIYNWIYASECAWKVLGYSREPILSVWLLDCALAKAYVQSCRHHLMNVKQEMTLQQKRCSSPVRYIGKRLKASEKAIKKQMQRISLLLALIFHFNRRWISTKTLFCGVFKIITNNVTQQQVRSLQQSSGLFRSAG